MQSTMNFNELQRQDSEKSYISDNSLRKKGRLWYRRSLKGRNDKIQQNTATLPRDWKQIKTSSNSLVDYSDPQRSSIVLQKQDNETYGFDIQTYGLPVKNSVPYELCTFVCRVQKDSTAENAGLTTGDVIITINGVSIEGSSHQHIVELIKESTNQLKIETVCSSIVKRIELDKKMSLLKQTLREKKLELQALTIQEKRLTRGNLNDRCPPPSLDSMSSVESPTVTGGHPRFSSDSSYRSVMTEDSDQTSVFGDPATPSPFSPASSSDDGIFFTLDLANREGSSRPSSGHSIGSSLARTLSSSQAGSISSLSPTWDETRASTLFGTLPRKGRRASVRRNILKFITGLQRSVEEEDLGTNMQAADKASESIK